jgi:hypothetical protein
VIFDATDDLVSENERQLRIRKLAVDNMKIGPANTARADANKELPPARLWFWNIAQNERRVRFLQNHRAHGDANRRLARAGGDRRIIGLLPATEVVLVIMRAPKEGNFIQHVFLEPFEPKINHRRHK